METIERYQQPQVMGDLAHFEYPGGFENDFNAGLVTPVLRRWRIVLLTFLLVCAVGVPAGWLIIKPVSQATAAIRVAPVIPSILFGDKDSEGVIPMYRNFMNTQADLIANEKVLQRVADDLVDKGLKFFKKPDNTVETLKSKLIGRQPNDPVVVLRRALISGSLTVKPERDSELIKISMKGDEPQECEQIVNSFVRAYMAIVVSDEVKGGDHKLTVLENEHRVLMDKLDRQRQTIREMAQEYGSEALQERHEMMLQRVADLQAKLTEVEMDKIALEAQVPLLERTKDRNMAPSDLLKLRYDFVNTDTMVQTLTSNIAQLEQALIVAKQTLAPTNPELQRKAELLEVLTQRLDRRRQEVGKTFDEMVTEELAKSDKDRLRNAKAQLEQTAIYEKRLRAMLAEEDTGTIKLGRKQLAIQDLQDQLNLTKELYETVQRRIQELEMERKRPARISVAYYANITPGANKYIKYTAVLAFLAMGLGIMLAILKDRADLSLRTPEDVVRRTGVRIIGTTIRSRNIKKSLLPQQVADDFQTIYANLGLFNGEGIPAKLVVSSPGPREGKTTVAINLAMSIAKTGKRVLLIDGDLRKPDIQRLLNLPVDCPVLQDIFANEKLGSVVCSTPMTGLYVLAADSKNPSDVSQLLSKLYARKYLNLLGQGYDHIIIDTPPVLAVPDALMWAKMAGAVVLTCFAARTEWPDLKEAFDRFAQINVRVLGTVLSNVPLNYSYNRYGYGYYANVAGNENRSRANTGKMVLLPMQKQD